MVVRVSVLLARFRPQEFPIGRIFIGPDIDHRGHNVVLPIVVLILAFNRIVLKRGSQRHIVALVYTLGLGLS